MDYIITLWIKMTEMTYVVELTFFCFVIFYYISLLVCVGGGVLLGK